MTVKKKELNKEEMDRKRKYEEKKKTRKNKEKRKGLLMKRNERLK